MADIVGVAAGNRRVVVRGARVIDAPEHVRATWTAATR